MVQIVKSINYSATIIKIFKEYWDEALLIFIFLMMISYFSSPSEVARTGLLSALGFVGGSAILGYILISLGGVVFMIPAGWTQIVGAIMIALGWVLAGASMIAVWSWIKSNVLLAGGIFVGMIFIWYNMRSHKRPIQPVYNIYQSPSGGSR